MRQAICNIISCQYFPFSQHPPPVNEKIPDNQQESDNKLIGPIFLSISLLSFS